MDFISRRKFIKRALVTTGAAGLSGHSMARERSLRKWELGMQGAKTMDCTLAEEIAITGRLGYDCLELRDWKLEAFLRERTMEDLQARFEKSGVRPINISAIELDSLGSGPDRDRMRERHEWYFRMAQQTGCQSALVVHFGPVPENLSAQEIQRRAVDDLRYMSDLAAQYEVMAIYEFLGSQKLPIHNLAATMEILGQANRDNLGWVFDFYQFHAADRSLEALAQSDVHKLSIVHICDAKGLPYEQLAPPNSERLLPGDGVCATGEILKTLSRLNYQGPFIIELYNDEFMKMKPEDFARIAKEKTVAVLNKYFQPEA